MGVEVHSLRVCHEGRLQDLIVAVVGMVVEEGRSLTGLLVRIVDRVNVKSNLGETTCSTAMDAGELVHHQRNGIMMRVATTYDRTRED